MLAVNLQANSFLNGIEMQDFKSVVPSILNSFGVLSVSGMLVKKPSHPGDAGYDEIKKQLENFKTNPKVDRILVKMDSAGGTITGCYELAHFINELRDIKPVAFFVDSCCCSAAYWLASQADYIICTPSATLGSVGVVRPYASITGVESLRAGKYKGFGFGTPDDDQKEEAQRSIDTTAELFRTHISSRREISLELMEGQQFNGFESVENGFADALVMSEEEALELLK